MNEMVRAETHRDVVPPNEFTRVPFVVNDSEVSGQWAVRSAYDFDATLEKLKSAIASHDLWLIAEIDPRKLLMRVGVEIESARQLLFFHPRYMKRLLEADARAMPEVPLKVAVFSTAAGEVYLRGPDMQVSLNRYAGTRELGEELASLCENIVSAVAAADGQQSVSVKLKPPFTREIALAKVQLAQDAWNTRDPARVALAYTEDSQWRNRNEFIQGRTAIVKFLERKWAKELNYRLMKELWAYTDNRISVRFEYEWHDHARQWFRSHGNEQWEFDADGLMCRRDASINDIAIAETDRRYR